MYNKFLDTLSHHFIVSVLTSPYDTFPPRILCIVHCFHSTLIHGTSMYQDIV